MCVIVLLQLLLLCITALQAVCYCVVAAVGLIASVAVRYSEVLCCCVFMFCVALIATRVPCACWMLCAILLYVDVSVAADAAAVDVQN